jgi:hypothetical protein
MIKKYVLWINNAYIGITLKETTVKIFSYKKNLYIMEVLVQDYFGYTNYLEVKTGSNKYKVYFQFTIIGKLEDVLKKFDDELFTYEKVSTFRRLLW